MKPKYYPDARYEPLRQDKQFENPYDVDSALLEDIVKRKLEPFTVLSFDLATPGIAVPININGTAIVQYGWETADGLLRTVDTTSSVMLFLETDPGPLPSAPTTGAPRVTGFPLKHARGYRGPFKQAWLYWTAQAGVSIDVIVHRYQGLPWIDGESAT